MEALKRYDIAIIGGGVNGCGVARDAAGRGLSVYLCEQNDLGGATSSASTKLVHGGLRYLEHYEFRLVREALTERETLLKLAPHIIWPMRFVLPHHRGLRPRWLLRLGLFLYDHLGGRKILPATRSLNLSTSPLGKPLKRAFTRGFEYSDCWVEDSRLVALNAMDAKTFGAVIEPRTKCVSAVREADGWRVTTEGPNGRQEIFASALVNAAGPWVSEVLAGAIRVNAPSAVRLVRGSHIVVPKLYDHDRAYIFQNADGRIVFAIPYETDFTLIGTTDRDHNGAPGEVRIDDDEIAYLCSAASEYFEKPIRREQIVWTYSGVRPLYDDGASSAQETTRDYVLELDADDDRAPLLSVFGGKITTYRKLAEAVMEKLSGPLNLKAGEWTATKPLPGGDFAHDGFDAQVFALRARHGYLTERHARRLVRAYGTRAPLVLGEARSMADLGRCFGADLTEAEVDYLRAHEFVTSAQDVMWRRSKLGLRLNGQERGALEAWFSDRAARPITVGNPSGETTAMGAAE